MINRHRIPIQASYLAIANRQAEIIMRVASEFGFTVAGRDACEGRGCDVFKCAR
jgi:hypothetical protein